MFLDVEKLLGDVNDVNLVEHNLCKCGSTGTFLNFY